MLAGRRALLMGRWARWMGSRGRVSAGRADGGLTARAQLSEALAETRLRHEALLDDRSGLEHTHQTHQVSAPRGQAREDTHHTHERTRTKRTR